jgi:hypothetical protein
LLGSLTWRGTGTLSLDGLISDSKGPVATVVASATMTRMLNSCLSMMPSVSPILSVISSVSPLVLISAAIAAESRGGIPASREQKYPGTAPPAGA